MAAGKQQSSLGALGVSNFLQCVLISEETFARRTEPTSRTKSAAARRAVVAAGESEIKLKANVYVSEEEGVNATVISGRVCSV